MIDHKLLSKAGDFTDIAKAMKGANCHYQEMLDWVCSLHPDRKIVALAPTEKNARLCQECLDALIAREADGAKRVDVRRLGEAGRADLHAEGLGADPTIGLGKAVDSARQGDAFSRPADRVGGHGLWNGSAGGTFTGAPTSQHGGVGDHAECSSAAPHDSEGPALGTFDWNSGREGR